MEFLMWILVAFAVLVVPPLMTMMGLIGGTADGEDGCLAVLWVLGGVCYVGAAILRVLELCWHAGFGIEAICWFVALLAIGGFGVWGNLSTRDTPPADRGIAQAVVAQLLICAVGVWCVALVARVVIGWAI